MFNLELKKLELIYVGCRQAVCFSYNLNNKRISLFITIWLKSAKYFNIILETTFNEQITKSSYKILKLDVICWKL